MTSGLLLFNTCYLHVQGLEDPTPPLSPLRAASGNPLAWSAHSGPKDIDMGMFGHLHALPSHRHGHSWASS